MERLEARTAVVTGAASGIGLAIVEAFVGEGMRVVMADVNEENLATHATRLTGQGADVLAIQADVTDPDAIASVGRAAMERFGTLHVAVNNAGVVSRGYSWEMPLDEWHRVIDVDLWGVINGIRTFVPLILASEEEGHVVNTASMAAVLPMDRLGPYTVAKHGVLGLSDVLRAEFAVLGAPIGVSVVMPGMIKTAMNPIGTVSADVVAARGRRDSPATQLRVHRRSWSQRAPGPARAHPLLQVRGDLKVTALVTREHRARRRSRPFIPSSCGIELTLRPHPQCDMRIVSCAHTGRGRRTPSTPQARGELPLTLFIVSIPFTIVAVAIADIPLIAMSRRELWHIASDLEQHRGRHRRTDHLHRHDVPDAHLGDQVPPHTAGHPAEGHRWHEPVLLHGN